MMQLFNLILKIILIKVLGLPLNHIGCIFLNLLTMTGETVRLKIIVINDLLMYKMISGPF